MSATRASMQSMPWQCAMHNFPSQTSCADGMDLFTIQPSSTPACCVYTWKMVVEEMAGCWGTVATESSHIYWPPSGLMMSPLHLKGDTRRPILKPGTPWKGPLAYGRPDFVALMYPVGHCSLILVVAALLLQQLLCCTICAFLTTRHSLGMLSNPLMNQIWWLRCQLNFKVMPVCWWEIALYIMCLPNLTL